MQLQIVGGLAGTKNRHRPPRRDGLTSSQESRNKQASMLAKAFRILHDQGGTTAVLNGCRDTLLDYNAEVLVEAAILAGNPLDGKKGFRSRGVSSGILNALLGCCISMTEDDNESSSRAKMAIQLMQAYDDVGKAKQQQNAFEPDLVSLCLAYVATSSIIADYHGADCCKDTNNDSAAAQKFLHRAEAFYPNTHHDSKKNVSHTTKSKQSPNWKELEEKYGIQVLQDADEFMIVSKPSGMVCYHGGRGEAKDNGFNQKRRKQQGTRDHGDKSLEECLLAYDVNLSTLNEEGQGLVHRIDRGTSGCLVMAKTNRMHALLLSQFFLRRSKKSYSALVCSRKEQLEKLAKNTGGQIVLPIESRPATSQFVFETSVGKHLCRIKVETQQGRRHQVRIHCSEGLGAPILLDPLYGGQSILAKLMRQNNSSSDNESGKSRSHKLLTEARAGQKFFLHASTLTIDAVGIDVHAPLPSWWQQLEEELS